jgi:hypothetical protein
VAAAQPGEVADLRFGQLEAVEDGCRVLGEQKTGLGGMNAVLGAPDELRAEPALEQRHLP